MLDTTVQEKNITFPTDVKLQKKIIEKCRKIADREGIELRQTYRRKLKQLMIDQRFHSHLRRKKKARAAARRIKVIAGRIVRDIDRKMDSSMKEKYEALFSILIKCWHRRKTVATKSTAYTSHM